MRDYIQLIAIVGAVGLGCAAAVQGNWELVSAVVVGLFALLKGGTT